MLSEPMRTKFDWNFELFNFPVRISCWFWLAAIVLGSNGNPRTVLAWVVAVFISILIHELGHAFAFRHFGVSSRIVLYHFGGLAVPDSYGSMGGRVNRANRPRNSMIISAAGPALQILSAVALFLILRAGGYAVPNPFNFLDHLVPIEPTRVLQNEMIRNFIGQYMFISIFWALLNLLPIYPLDGGQIARDLFILFGGGDGLPKSLILSTCTGAGVAVYGFSRGMPFLAIMFAMLAYSSYQALQAYTGHRRL